jgi:hypothetical protein
MVYKIISPQPMRKKMQQKTKNSIKNPACTKMHKKNTKSLNKIAHLLNRKKKSIIPKNRIFCFLSNTCTQTLSGHPSVYMCMLYLKTLAVCADSLTGTHSSTFFFLTLTVDHQYGEHHYHIVFFVLIFYAIFSSRSKWQA